MTKFFIKYLALALLFSMSNMVQAKELKAGASGKPKKELELAKELGEKRLNLVSEALNVAKKYHKFGYKYGGASPDDGGFDCSGAMYYVMRKIGLTPPRTSAQQFVWIRDKGEIHLMPEGNTDLGHACFAMLRPGDLLFWSGTYQPTDGRKVKITHVAVYLGEEKDGRHIMASSTSGRSYRGKKGNGYGIYDFKLPSKVSRSKFVGYGSPIGLDEEVDKEADK